jgi:hypothetical protein
LVGGKKDPATGKGLKTPKTLSIPDLQPFPKKPIRVKTRMGSFESRWQRTVMTLLLEVHFKMQQRGQGSLEYLLIIGGGILVAVVIIGAIVTLAGTGTGGTKANVANQTCHTYLTKAMCENVNNNVGTATHAVECAAPYDVTTTNPPCCWNSASGVADGSRCNANPGNTY